MNARQQPPLAPFDAVGLVRELAAQDEAFRFQLLERDLHCVALPCPIAPRSGAAVVGPLISTRPRTSILLSIVRAHLAHPAMPASDTAA